MLYCMHTAMQQSSILPFCLDAVVNMRSFSATRKQAKLNESKAEDWRQPCVSKAANTRKYISVKYITPTGNPLPVKDGPGR